MTVAKQIHELDPAGPLTPEDRLLVSTVSGNLTRRATFADLPYRAPGASAPRPVHDRLGEFVSVRDFGAVGDGVADDAPAFAAALAAHEQVFVPPGTYRLAAPVDVPPRRHLVGAGRDLAVLVAEGPQALVVRRNEGAFQVEPFADTNWNRVTVEGFTIRMTTGGIRVHGHEFRARDLVFTGGAAPAGLDDPDGWCLDMVDANECWIGGINAGLGGGAHALACNGIRWRAAMPGVNFGDSLVQEVAIRLGAPNTVGIHLDGAAADATKLINNMLLQRIQVTAPQSGLTPHPGTVGFRLRNCARVLLLLCDAEIVEVGFEEYSESAGTSGRNSANTYMLCQTHNVPDPANRYRDSNATFPNSCVKRTFVGCNFMGPAPVGNYPGDGGVLGDTGLVAREINGLDKYDQLAWQIRARDRGVPMLTAHYKGAAQSDYDTHPAVDRPARGILFDITSFQMAAITRTVANGDPNPDTGQPMMDVRLTLGNGEGSARGELARIEIADPLYLFPRTTPPPRQKAGLAVYATDPAVLPATGEQWLGPGWYLQLEDDPGVLTWVPLGVRRGVQPERVRNLSWTVSRADFGKVHRVNHAQERICTIPAGLVAPGEGLRWFDVIKQGVGDVVFEAGPGVTLYLPKGKNRIRTQYQRVRVYVTGNDEVFIPDLFPDGDENHFLRVHRTAGGFAVPGHYVGQLIRVTAGATTFLEVPTGLVPPGVECVWFKVQKGGPGDVEIRAGAGMTLAAPGGVDPYVITQPRKTVTVYVTAADEPQEPNHVYIED